MKKLALCISTVCALLMAPASVGENEKENEKKVTVDYCPEKVMILGTGKAILPVDASKHRRAVLTKKLSAPIEKTLLENQKGYEEILKGVAANKGELVQDEES